MNMQKKLLQLFLLFLSLTSYQLSFAHGVGSSSSYQFDKKDLAAEHEAEKKIAEEKKDQDTWADFMKVVNKSKKEKSVEKSHDHDDSLVE